jgi:hypothetical protein
LLLAAVPDPAFADPLGNRIAEMLCYPPSAKTMAISDAERDRLYSAPPVSGGYRDIQGSDARAWFEVLDDGTARCRTPATGDLSLFLCSPVTVDRGMLRRGTNRLCQIS